jgi:hypothetical protein
MPEEFDPAWEYYTGDFEVEEILADNNNSRSDHRIPYAVDGKGRNILSGFRVGNPKGGIFRLAFGKYEQQKSTYRCPIDCVKCGWTFNPRTNKQRFCSRYCFIGRERLERLSYSKLCANSLCGNPFCTRIDTRKYCSSECALISRFGGESNVRSYDNLPKGSIVLNKERTCNNLKCHKKFIARRVSQKYCSIYCNPGRSDNKLSEKQCQECKFMFQPIRSWIRFCSRRCSRIYLVKTNGQYGNINSIKRNCQMCFTEFIVKYHTNRFCSPSCGGKYYSTSVKLTELSQDEINAGMCEICHGKVEIKQSVGRWKYKKYCSKRCKNVAANRRYYAKSKSS